MLIAGWIATLLIGLSLGIIGAGGSILTVPALTYLFGVPATLATAYSLFVVGTTALVGATGFLKRREADLRAALAFAVPSMLGVFAMRRFGVPAIPDPVLGLAKDTFILLLFAALMVAAAVRMIRPDRGGTVQPKPSWVVALVGLVVGLIAGLVGAGGGFLIVPAMVYMVGLPMRTAVGTSLLVIAAQSLFGFTGDVMAGQAIEWQFLLTVAAIASSGAIVGNAVGKSISGEKLKPAFGWFVLGMGIFIVLRETVL